MIAIHPNSTSPSPRRSIRWPLIVLGLLVGHMTLMMIAVFIITRDHRDGIIPDHYQKSVDWDRSHSQTGPAGRMP